MFLAFSLLASFFAQLIDGDKLLCTQMLWRHGLRTPGSTYANDPYNEAFWGVPGGELLAEGMRQHFIRGQQLKKLYVEDHQLVSAKYSRYETLVKSADMPRCSQSALANLAGFYSGSPTFPTNVPDWPSAWTPIPIHTVPHDEDYILEAFDGVCAKQKKLSNFRMQRQEFLDFVASNWRVLYTINQNSGDPENWTFFAIVKMYGALNIEKKCNLTFPDWVTDEFFNELQDAYLAGNDYTNGEGGFGLEMDPEMTKLSAGFLLNEWMNNIHDVINNSTTVKYYAYSGHDIEINSIMIGLGIKQELYGPGNTDYASTLVCELWEKDGSHFVKLLYSANIDSDFVPITGKLAGCTSDLCSLPDFQATLQSLLADDPKICM